MDNTNKFNKTPLKLDFPYSVTLQTKGDAANYVLNQCINCPKFNRAFECSGACIAQCCEVINTVVEYFTITNEDCH